MAANRRFIPVALVFLGCASLGPAGDPDVSMAQPQPPPPACAVPEHHQFDFWIGEWNVTTPDGKPAGTNRIERIAGGCGLLENWTGAKGGVGNSLNFYSPDDRKWHQTWVGTGGSFLFLEGAFENGAMTMTGRTKTAEGGAQLERITWTPQEGGIVKQHWQQSTDDGKTWADAFVGLYKKK